MSITPPRSASPGWALLALLLLSPAAWGQAPFTAEILKEGPPAGLSAEIKATLAPTGYRVVSADGKPYADLWIRSAVPASGKPAGADGTVQFPVLADGVLLGALRFPAEGHDFRDQAIAPGIYTLRYGLQPQNGAHLGASLYRDFTLLLPAAKDESTAVVPKRSLEQRSAEAAGTSHPGVLMMIAAPEPSRSAAPAMVEDADRSTWALAVTIPLQVAGGGSSSIDVQLIVSGSATQ